MHLEGRHREVVAALVAGYGDELVGFMAVLLGDVHEAREVFGDVSETLLRNIERFEGRSSFRTWSYAIARNAALNARRGQRPQRLRTTEAIGLSVPERTATRPYQQTENKLLLARLRRELSWDEQTLLTLRLDRGMSWRAIAVVLGEGDGVGGVASGNFARTSVDPANVDAREVARLRKRFERLKERLKDAFLKHKAQQSAPRSPGPRKR